MPTIFLPMVPVPCPRPKFNRRTGSTYYPARYSKWKVEASKKVRALALKAGLMAPLGGPLVVGLTFVFPRPKTTKLQFPKPDLDNLSKSALDAGNGILWNDDTQVTGLVANKSWAAPGDPGYVQIDFTELPPV